MSGFTSLEIAGIVWAAVGVIYLALFLVHSLMGMKEEDTIYLSAAEAKLEQAQREVMTRLYKLEYYQHRVGYLLIAVTVVLVGMWGYNAFQQLY